MQGKTFENVDEYLATFPEDIRKVGEEMRRIIKAAAPETQEIISYNMPAYRLHSVLVYFALYKGHIGLYPTSSGILAFQKEISAYKNSKGAVQFPLNKPLPEALIKSIVQFRIQDDLERQLLKSMKKKK